jgi:aspartate aminotransferase
MTGWRIGYAAGPAPLIRAMVNVQSQSTSNPTSIAQVGAETALDGDQSFIAEMVQAFKARHDYVVAALNRLRGVRCLPAHGAFYLFPDIHEAMRARNAPDDVAFADWLLREAGVAVVPGSAFGAPGFMRISIATAMPTLERAMARLEQVLGWA